MNTKQPLLSLAIACLAAPLLVACPTDDGSSDDMDSTDGSTDDGMTDDGTTDDGTTDDGTTDDGTTDDGTTEDDTSDTTGEELAELRVLHLGVGVPGVDVFVNETEPAAITDLEFRVSTGYVEVPAATDLTFQVALAGGTPADAAITAGPLQLDADGQFTAVAVGDLAADNLEILAVADDASDLDPANVRLQVIHAAPAVGQVDIWLLPEDGDPTPLLTDVDYTASGVLDVPPALYVLGLDVDDDAIPDLTVDVDITAVEGGTFLNVFANNDVEGGFALLAQLPDGSILTIEPN